MTEDTSRGFFSRWSQQKLKAQAPVAPAAEVPTAQTSHPIQTVASPAPQPQGSPPTESAPVQTPTWDDVAALTPGSDFTRFVGRHVDPRVRNAALKTLFKDPHFNVMDGLDVYIEDFGKPDPLPAGMLEQMTQTRALGLWADPADEATAGEFSPGSAESKEASTIETRLSTAQTSSSCPTPPPSATAPSPHEDPDLRLQSDDPTRRPGAASGPVLDTGHER